MKICMSRVFFSCHGRKYHLVHSSEKYRLSSEKLCPGKNFPPSRKFLAFCLRNPNFNPRKCPSARENMWNQWNSGEKNKFQPRQNLKKQRKNAFSSTFHFFGGKRLYAPMLKLSSYVNKFYPNFGHTIFVRALHFGRVGDLEVEMDKIPYGEFYFALHPSSPSNLSKLEKFF